MTRLQLLKELRLLEVDKHIEIDDSVHYLSQICNYVSKKGKIFIHENLNGFRFIKRIK